MKRLILFLVIIVICVAGFSQFSLGLSLGQPSGVTAKYIITDNIAVDLCAAYSFLWAFSGYYINLDAVYLLQDVLVIGDTVLPLHAGIGIGYLGLTALQAFGAYVVSVRIPVGASYYFDISDNKFEAFAEIAPTINVTPIQSFSLSFRIGARYVF